LKSISLKKRILLPLTLALCVLFVAFIVNVYYSQNRAISQGVQKHLEATQMLFNKKLHSDTELMNAIIEMAIFKNPQIQAAFLAKDRTRLTELTLPLLEELRSKYRITHLYFHDANLVTFLRVHNLKDYGDISKRYTVQMAKESGRPFSGIEIGLFGTFTLRVVQPWWVNGEVVGYIQLGERIDHIVKKLHDVLGVELYVSIYKEFLHRKKWEKGMRQYIGRDPHWDQFSTAVIIDQTLDEIPEVIGRLLEKGHHDYRQVSPDRTLSLAGRHYRYRFLPLDEVSGREVGDLVVLIDVTEQLADLYETILLTAGICFVVGLMLLVFLYHVLGWVERKLKSSQAELMELGSTSHGLVKEGIEWELASEFSSPARIVTIIAISIFIAEFIVMFILSLLPSLSPVAEMFLDSLLLLGLISPVLGVLLFRPLILHITHRMRVEKELIFEKEKLIKVYESSPDAVVVLDRDCRIEYANKVTENISGIALSEMKGKRCFEIIIGRNSICDGCMIEEVIKKKKTESRIKHELTAARAENWLWQIWYPVFNQKGEVENVVEIARDMTDQKRAEEELKKTARELRNLSRHQQTIREEERAHIAREIHDELGQLLTATQLELRNLTNKLPQDKKYLREKAGSIAKIIDTGIQTVKEISADLRPCILDDLGLVPALEDYAEEFQTRTGIACELVFDTDEIALDKDCSTAVFRIFQESFTNVARHARASKITAHMAKENGSLMLQITDNGRGSVKENIASTESFGLLGMKERAQSVGGEIEINSVEGKGTTVTLTIPLSLKGEQPR